MKINSIGSSVINSQDIRNTNSDNVDKSEFIKKVNNEKRDDIDKDNIISDEMLDNAVKQANKTLEQYDKMIERTVHEKTHTIIYVLKDVNTKEVIREFPPKKIQDMIAKMWEMAGILVDERR